VAGRLQRGHAEARVPANQDRVRARPAGRRRWHDLKPGFPQRIGQPALAEDQHPAVASPPEHRDRAAGRRQHAVVGQLEADRSQRPRVLPRRLGRSVRQDRVREPLPVCPPGDLQRARQRRQAPALPVAEYKRAVHVEDEAARVPQPPQHVIGGH